MIDCRGNTILVGFSEVEDIYIRAALELNRGERLEAFQQIADMAGRKFFSVSNRAKFLAAEDRKTARAFLETILRKNWQSESLQDGSRQAFVPARTIQGRHLVTPRSAFSVSEAAKMSGNARTVKARAAE